MVKQNLQHPSMMVKVMAMKQDEGHLPVSRWQMWRQGAMKYGSFIIYMMSNHII
jgi:hypothetical protein